MHHPADLLLVAGSCFVLAGALLSLGWLQGTVPGDLGWRARLRWRGRRHPVLARAQYACLILAAVLLVAYAMVGLGGTG
jgi:hypothetical protein